MPYRLWKRKRCSGTSDVHAKEAESRNFPEGNIRRQIEKFGAKGLQHIIPFKPLTDLET